MNLRRVDTIGNFQRAVHKADVDELVSPKPLERIETMSGLPAVKDAFEAIGEASSTASAGANATSSSRDADGNGGSASSTAMPPPATPATAATSGPQPVRRIDTMELLQDPIGGTTADEVAEAARPTKRARPV